MTKCEAKKEKKKKIELMVWTEDNNIFWNVKNIIKVLIEFKSEIRKMKIIGDVKIDISVRDIGCNVLGIDATNRHKIVYYWIFEKKRTVNQAEM